MSSIYINWLTFNLERLSYSPRISVFLTHVVEHDGSGPSYAMRSSKMSLKSVKLNLNFSDWLYTLYIICKDTFYNRPYWNLSVGFKDTGSWRAAKTMGNKEIIFYQLCSIGYILKSVFCLITTHTMILKPFQDVCDVHPSPFSNEWWMFNLSNKTPLGLKDPYKEKRRRRRKKKAVLEPRVSPVFAIMYFCNNCNIRFENTSK